MIFFFFFADPERELVSGFMSVLKKETLITTSQFLDALKELVNQMAEKEQEIPRIFSHVAGNFIGYITH
jgi:hypothetical protein